MGSMAGFPLLLHLDPPRCSRPSTVSLLVYTPTLIISPTSFFIADCFLASPISHRSSQITVNLVSLRIRCQITIVYLSVCLSVCLTVCLSVCLSLEYVLPYSWWNLEYVPPTVEYVVTATPVPPE